MRGKDGLTEKVRIIKFKWCQSGVKRKNRGNLTSGVASVLLENLLKKQMTGIEPEHTPLFH